MGSLFLIEVTPNRQAVTQCRCMYSPSSSDVDLCREARAGNEERFAAGECDCEWRAVDVGDARRAAPERTGQVPVPGRRQSRGPVLLAQQLPRAHQSAAVRARLFAQFGRDRGARRALRPRARRLRRSRHCRPQQQPQRGRNWHNWRAPLALALDTRAVADTRAAALPLPRSDSLPARSASVLCATPLTVLTESPPVRREPLARERPAHVPAADTRSTACARALLFAGRTDRRRRPADSTDRTDSTVGTRRLLAAAALVL